MFGRYHISTNPREPKQLRSTRSCIYYTDDKIGEGATGSVFGGREKKSCERVAVKVFNNVRYRRPDSVQNREFGVLLKLKHPNIVKLLAIEEDSSSHDRVIIMELCEGGSLLNVLDRPENSFGLAETEFKILLRDVSQGMKHLQDKGIVHRDLKPGNIMCCFDPDGSSVYKLADFGAARELAEGENFVSLYGTEEYLHPDMYERAVLQKPLVRPFTASVDLWSIGITLYHATTGVLPFRPYGGRRNRSTMHMMTTQKAAGIISGVQINSENAPIEWSNKLPNTTQLSQGLRFFVEEMLAGLLENDKTRMWSFHKFFDAAQTIDNMTVVDVFDTVNSQLIKIYICPSYPFTAFKEYVAIQTTLQSVRQIYVFENAAFHPELNVPCRDFPETTSANPIFLFKSTFCGDVSPVAFCIETVSQLPPGHSPSEDAVLTKKRIASLFCLKRKQDALLLFQKLQNAALNSLHGIIKEDMKNLEPQLIIRKMQIKKLPKELQGMKFRVDAIQKLGGVCRYTDNGRQLRLGENLDALNESFGKEFALKTWKIRKLLLQHEDLVKQLSLICSRVMDLNVLRKELNRKPGCHQKDKCKCVDRFDNMFHSQLEIFSNFCRDSKDSSLMGNAEIIHNVERLKFNDTLQKMLSLVHDHCASAWLEKHCEMWKWFLEAYSIEERLNALRQGEATLSLEMSAEKLAISELDQKCSLTLNSIESDISRVNAANSLFAKTQLQDAYPPLVTLSTRGQSSQVQLRGKTQLQEASTQTPWRVQPNGGSSIDGQHQVYSRTNTGAAALKVEMPRDLKRELQDWPQQRADIQVVVDKNEDVITDVTEEIQNMSLYPRPIP